MSYTFYVTDWEKQPTVEVKTYLRDLYNETEEDVIQYTLPHYPEAQEDENGWYIVKEEHLDAFPEAHVVNGHLTPILKTVGMPFDHHGVIPLEYNKDVQASIIKSLNISSMADKNSVETERSGNFISCGINGDQIREKLEQIAVVLKFAQEHKKDVYWA